MTNLEKIRNRPVEYFAYLGIYATETEEYDEGLDGEWFQCGESTDYTSVYTGRTFSNYQDAYEDNIRWLRSEAGDEDEKDIHWLKCQNVSYGFN